MIGVVLLVVATVGAASPVSDIPVTVDEIRTMIVAEALASRTVPPELALAVAREESNFDPVAVSYAGARGVMQVMPSTAAREFGIDPDLLWDPRVNIRVGVAHLAALYRRYGDSWPAALSHYNGGTLRVNATGQAVQHRFTGRYVRSVMRRWREYDIDVAIARLVIGVQRAAQPAALAARSENPPAPTRGERGAARVAPAASTRPGLLDDIRRARQNFRRALRARSAGR